MCLALESLVEELCSRWRKRGQLVDLRTRVGLASGYCAIGDWGGSRRLDYTAIGAAVNLASRLQQEAGVGGALVCAATAALLGADVDAGAIECGPLQQLNIKGFGNVQAYLLVTDAVSAKVRAY